MFTGHAGPDVLTQICLHLIISLSDMNLKHSNVNKHQRLFFKLMRSHRHKGSHAAITHTQNLFPDRQTKQSNDTMPISHNAKDLQVLLIPG